MREERRLRVFENKLLRGIFDSRMDEVTGEWRKLNNEEIHDLYTSPIIVPVIKSRRIILVGCVAWMGEGRVVYRVSVGKLEGKRPLRRFSFRWEDNIKIDLQGVGCEGMDWFKVARDRESWQALVNVVMNFPVP
jgi:hypothetical protein